MLGSTAAEVYGFDLAQLRPLADRIGPPAGEHRRLTRVGATEEPMNRYLVISSDCHAGLPPGGYREYLDPDYRERYERGRARSTSRRPARRAS